MAVHNVQQEVEGLNLKKEQQVKKLSELMQQLKEKEKEKEVSVR